VTTSLERKGVDRDFGQEGRGARSIRGIPSLYNTCVIRPLIPQGLLSLKKLYMQISCRHPEKPRHHPTPTWRNIAGTIGITTIQ